MSILMDLSIIIILVLFAWLGSKRGLIKTLTSTISIVFSIVGANFISKLLPFIADDKSYLVALIVIFLVLNSILSLIAKIINLAAKLPVIKTVNKILGLVCGLIFAYFVIAAVSIYLVGAQIISLEAFGDTYIMKYIVESASSMFASYISTLTPETFIR